MLITWLKLKRFSCNHGRKSQAAQASVQPSLAVPLCSNEPQTTHNITYLLWKNTKILRAAQHLSKPLRESRSERWQCSDDFRAYVRLILARSQANKPYQSEIIKHTNESHTWKAVWCIRQLVRPGARIRRGKPGARDGRDTHTNYTFAICGPMACFL